MKKYILFGFIVFFSFINLVNGEVYYGEYKYVGNLELELSDEVKREEIKLYNTYTLEYKDLGYVESNPLYIKDENDYIDSEIILKEYEDGAVEYVNLKIDDLVIRSLRLKNVSIGTKISEIEFLYDNEKIDVDIMGTNFYYGRNLSDGNYDTFSEAYREPAIVTFRFNDFIEMNKLEMIIYTYEENIDSSFKFIAEFCESNVKLSNSNKHVYDFVDYINEDEYFYKKNVRLYRHYEEIKELNDIYVVDGDNLVLDDYKFINKYYKRDKLVLSDNNIINDQYKDIYSFIEYSSDDVEVICDINYLVNGEYKCIYSLNDINVEKNIIVNNVIEESKEVEEIEDVVVEEVNVYDNVDEYIILNSDHKEKKVVEEDIISENNKELVNGENEFKINNKNDIKNNFLINLIKYLIVSVCIMVEVLFFIKKKKRNRNNVEKV